MHNTLSVEIERPIAEVFELATKHVSEWSITCVEDEVIHETPEGVGTTFRIVTEERGQRMEFEGVVVKSEPPTLSAARMVGKAFDIDVLYRLEDLGGRTRLTQESEVRGKGIFKLVIVVMGLFMRKSSCDAQVNELESLKRYCEERAGA